jgi:hypothetical protein
MYTGGLKRANRRIARFPKAVLVATAFSVSSVRVSERNPLIRIRSASV